ncbi:hypothetical protein WA588_000912 [Blastocystis sp. NMH]
MQAITVCKVSKSLSCHCWNKDKSQVALATRNSNDIYVYNTCHSSNFENWKLIHTLSGHDLPVTALDWDPNYNRILSCSEDCNAYVWNYEDGKWIPTLVVLKIKRAALCCKWSPNGKAFAVGSSERKLRICTFNADQNLWVHPSGLRVKQEQEEEGGDSTPVVANKTRGSIFCVCWDRTGQLLCRGSLDGSMSIVSTYYDPSEPIRECPFDVASKELFGFVFGDKCGVVEDIAVSQNNQVIAYTDRNSDVHFLEFKGHAMSKQTVHCPTLPFTCLLFITDTILAAGGFDNNLHILVKKSEWEYVGVADTSSSTSSLGMSSSFQQRIRMLQSNANVSDVNATNSRTNTTSNGPHKNAIQQLQPWKETPTMCAEITSCGLDGRLVFWNMEVILKKMNLL